MKLRRSVVLSAIFLVSALAFAQSSSKPASNGAAKPLGAGRTAPDFTRNTLDGKPIHLASYKGKLVLLNFWATWCGPCLTEIPRFNTWQTKYGAQGLQVLGVSMDEEPTPVQKAARKLQFTYPVVMGDEKIEASYGGLVGLPISYIIGPDGKIIDRLQGETNLDALEKRITTLLALQKH